MQYIARPGLNINHIWIDYSNTEVQQMACSKVGGSNQTTISIGFMCKPHKTNHLILHPRIKLVFPWTCVHSLQLMSFKQSIGAHACFSFRAVFFIYTMTCTHQANHLKCDINSLLSHRIRKLLPTKWSMRYAWLAFNKHSVWICFQHLF